MASYQVPQFLDSGEKILGPMNIRQLGYFLFGFGVSTLIYSLVQYIITGIGAYAAIPTLPVLAIFGYLAIGKYNGRDSEVYVFKMFIYLTKPRLMKFKRQPDYNEIEQRAKENTYEKIAARINGSNALKDKFNVTNIEDSFNSDPNDKVAQIKLLSKKVDTIQTIALETSKKTQKLNAEREAMINNWRKINKR
jgi:hypothetical protein